jgi:hypothetical protein
LKCSLQKVWESFFQKKDQKALIFHVIRVLRPKLGHYTVIKAGFAELKGGLLAADFR